MPSSTGTPTQPSTSIGLSALSTDLLPVLEFARRWWLLAIVMTSLTTLSSLALVVQRGAEYQVSAALFFKLGPEIAPPATMGNDPLVITRRAEDVNNEIEILTSPDLVHQVVQELGEGFFRAPPPTTTWGKVKRQAKQAIAFVTDGIEEMLIQAGLRRRLSLLEKIELGVSKKLKVELVRESDVISLTLDTPAPEAGVLIVQKLLDAYQARHLTIHQEVDVKEFLTQQTTQLREQLAKSSENMLTFQQSADVWSVEEQQKLLLDNRKTLQMQVAATSRQVAYLEAQITSLSESVAHLPEVIELSRSEQLNPAVIDIEDRLASLQLNLAVVETAYIPSSRETSDRRSQIQGLRKQLQEQPEMVLHSMTTGLNAMRQELAIDHSLKSAELKGLREQLAVEERQLISVNQELQELGAAVAKFQQLQREHRLLEQKYALYSEHFQKADISAVMNLAQISNMELISPPLASKEPVGPRLLLTLAAGILTGLAVAFLLGVSFDMRSALRTRHASN